MSLTVVQTEPVSITLQEKFDLFWKAVPYPRRLDKALCWSYFQKACGPDPWTRRIKDKETNELVELTTDPMGPEQIIAAMQRYERSLPREGNGIRFKDAQYIVTPSVWLHRGRYGD